MRCKIENMEKKNRKVTYGLEDPNNKSCKDLTGCRKANQALAFKSKCTLKAGNLYQT